MDCVSPEIHLGSCDSRRTAAKAAADKTGSDIIARIVEFEIAEDADNFKAAGVLRKVDAEMLTDGILIGKEPLYESLVDQRLPAERWPCPDR